MIKQKNRIEYIFSNKQAIVKRIKKVKERDKGLCRKRYKVRKRNEEFARQKKTHFNKKKTTLKLVYKHLLSHKESFRNIILNSTRVLKTVTHRQIDRLTCILSYLLKDRQSDKVSKIVYCIVTYIKNNITCIKQFLCVGIKLAFLIPPRSQNVMP